MSDANLLAFGCAVTFIALGGIYIYLRESWAMREQRMESEERPAELVGEVLRDSA